MKETPLASSEALALLLENSARLGALAAGARHETLHSAPGPGKWSPNEVLAHLRACSDTWGGNITRILADEHPTFAGRSPRTWMKQTDYPEWPFERALTAFLTQRRKLLDTLDALPAAGWERNATVTSYGLAHERTLRSYASQLAQHERSHVRQIERILDPETLARPSRKSPARKRS